MRPTRITHRPPRSGRAAIGQCAPMSPEATHQSAGTVAAVTHMPDVCSWNLADQQQGVHAARVLQTLGWMMRAALTVLVLAIVVVASACSGSPQTGPTEARNDGEYPGVVRLVGSTGSVDFAVPAYSLVRLNAPASIGTVGYVMVANHNCFFFESHPYGTNGLAAFEVGGLMVFGDSIWPPTAFSDTTGWVGATPPPAPDAATTTMCASVNPAG